jgi:hypothetical protein
MGLEVACGGRLAGRVDAFEELDGGVVQGGQHLGALPVRTRQRSSPSVSSRTSCEPFSIPQCPLTSSIRGIRSGCRRVRFVIPHTVSALLRSRLALLFL